VTSITTEPSGSRLTGQPWITRSTLDIGELDLATPATSGKNEGEVSDGYQDEAEQNEYDPSMRTPAARIPHHA
jgi:hypothetical protein